MASCVCLKSVQSFESALDGKYVAQYPVVQMRPLDDSRKPTSCSELLGCTFVTRDGEVLGAEAVEGKVVGVFFATGSETCTAFASRLAAWYPTIKSRLPGFEIVLVAQDASVKEFEAHLQTMPWLAIPYTEQSRIDQLTTMMDAQFPSLVIIDQDGQVLTKGGGKVLKDAKNKTLEPQVLSRKILESVVHPELLLPTYTRDCEAFIVHLGVGGFHRSHQAMYTDRLLQHYHCNPQERPAETFGICGVGLRPFVSESNPGDEPMERVLKQQDGLYTLMVSDEKGPRATVIGSIMDFMLAPRNYPATIERMANPSTKIVSMTVTEKGYFMDLHGNLDTKHPGVAHDLKNYKEPQTIYGLICASLHERMQRGQQAFTILSCDNMPDNGDTVKRLLTQFIEIADPGLKDWVLQNATFPNTMVDRITPVTEERHKVTLAETFGVVDQWPVVAEPFTQWVIEDHFVCGRPEWEKMGALFVNDVKPYEYMKLRLLNGAHSALCYTGYLAGYNTVDDLMADGVLGPYVKAYIDSVIPCIPPVPGVDLKEYGQTLCERFSNTFINDKVIRLVEDGSKKLYAVMRGPVLELTAAGKHTGWLAVSFAGFIQFMSAEDIAGQPIRCIRDPMAEQLQPLCIEACLSLDVRPPLCLVFGDEILAAEKFVSEVSEALRDMRTRGVFGMIQDRLEQESS